MSEVNPFAMERAHGGSEHFAVNLLKDGGTHHHAVRFYESDESLCRIVAEFLGEGLIVGQPALVVATPEHRAGIIEQLRAEEKL